MTLQKGLWKVFIVPTVQAEYGLWSNWCCWWHFFSVKGINIPAKCQISLLFLIFLMILIKNVPYNAIYCHNPHAYMAYSGFNTTSGHLAILWLNSNGRQYGEDMGFMLRACTGDGVNV